MQNECLDLGRMRYSECVQLQRNILEEVLSGQRGHTLLLVEHEPVLTLGSNFHASNLLYPVSVYEDRGIEVIKTDRGGDVTYHGPGQLVAYPIFNVEKLGKDLHKWMRDLEEVVIQTLQTLDIAGERLPVNSGVWVNQKKICAIGIKMRRWVSMHGIALNCNLDLAPFDMIIPCGIRDYGVTTVSQQLSRPISVEEMKVPLIAGFERVFNVELKVPQPVALIS